MRHLLAANWKMHLYPGQARDLLYKLVKHWETYQWDTHQTIIFPPYIYLREAVELVRNSPLSIGAQNGYPGEFGAFTGEISMAQIAACGVRWVLVGHSERRQYFGEVSALLQEKLLDAQRRNLSVVYCIGETLPQRQRGETFAILRQQLVEVLSSGVDWTNLAIAYEPVWAIGTGVNATPAQAQEAHSFIRSVVAELGAPADSIPILYGGSLKPENAREIFQQPDVDGGLVGGASLDAASFIAIASALWG
ncbi:MAG: triose-phosphate isomerase [Bacteroidia bacterium]|nr:triose-phosphate isomerase [Bacteroidia bacterium]MCX7652425.1 triose-phosphate isomerase [Bacteroidia bacterium]MDW8417342.1 triose-phosphate isomerase [Bacteroidia bacterium]